jgi:hypothetical protein
MFLRDIKSIEMGIPAIKLSKFDNYGTVEYIFVCRCVQEMELF